MAVRIHVVGIKIMEIFSWYYRSQSLKWFFFFLLYYIFLNLIKVLQLYILNIKLWHFSRWKMEFDVTYTKNKILNFGQCSGSSSLFISTWYKILPVFLCLSGILVTLKGCAVLDEWLWRKDHLYRSLD